MEFKIIEGLTLPRDIISVNGEDISVFKADRDANGNSRFIVHYLSLGLKDYVNISYLTSFKKYRGKKFGGGYVFQSHNDKQTISKKIEWAIEELKKANIVE